MKSSGRGKMIRNHDRWSKLGEENLGEINIQFAERSESFPLSPPGSGPMMLMKAIINDYWADDSSRDAWSREHVDIVMSKLYWCWVAWLECAHLEVEDNEV
jgi:hypothetical protein